MQRRAAECQVLAGYLHAFSQSTQFWAKCDRCEKWRLVDQATSDAVERGGSFECSDDKARPIRGCNIALLPGSSEPHDDDVFLQQTAHLLPLV